MLVIPMLCMVILMPNPHVVTVKMSICGSYFWHKSHSIVLMLVTVILKLDTDMLMLVISMLCMVMLMLCPHVVTVKMSMCGSYFWHKSHPI